MGPNPQTCPHLGSGLGTPRQSSGGKWRRGRLASTIAYMRIVQVVWVAGLVTGFALGLVGCTAVVKALAEARVECSGSVAGLSCTASQTGGFVPLNVAWDFDGSCANGLRVHATATATVEPGAQVHVTIPVEQIEHLSECDQLITTAVTNVRADP